MAWLVTTGVARPHAEAPPAAQPLSLDLVVSRVALPPLSARIMRNEVEHIWAREGVTVTWRTSEELVSRGARYIKITIVNDAERPLRTPASYVLGDFLANEGRIRISLFAAMRAAREATAAIRRPKETLVYPTALGYVLARAIAHEIGHALLGSGHTETGLMSARFSPAAMADSSSSRFRLDQASAAQLASAFGTRLLVQNAGQPAQRLKREPTSTSSSSGN